MGGVCSKSTTKAAKSRDAAGKDRAGAAAAAAAPHAEDASSVNSNPNYRVGDNTATAAAGASTSHPARLSNDSAFTISSHDDSGNASHVVSSPLPFGSNAHPDDRSQIENSKGSDGTAPMLAATAPRMHSSSAIIVTSAAAAAAAADSASPLPTGQGYDAYFPLHHDAGMKLGSGKYNGVGVSPFSSLRSPELVSLASSAAPHHGREMRKGGGGGGNAPLPQPSRAPITFADDDTSMMETASSAFATPREVHEGAAGFTDNASIVSHGSMMSQRPHGYEYYNSNAMEGGYIPTPSSASVSQPPSVAAASPSRSINVPSQAQMPAAGTQPLARWPLNTMTVTNVSTNKQQLATSSFGVPGTPMTSRSSFAGSERFQSCRSLTDGSAVPSPSSPSPGLNTSPSTGRAFYTCRTVFTTSSEAPSLTPPRAALAGSLPMTRTQSGTPLLPPCSPLQTPRGPGLFLGTPRGQQLLQQRQAASLRSAPGDGAASDAFFSVPPSASDVFLDLPSAAASTPAELHTDANANTSEGRSGPSRAAAAPAPSADKSSKRPSQGDSSAAAAAAAAAAATAASSRRSASASASSASSFFADSANASSAASGWMDTPALTKPKARDGSRTAGAVADSGRASHRSAPGVRKQYYTRADFPPNPNPPPQLQQILATRAAAAALREPSVETSRAAAPSTAVGDAAPTAPVITTTTASLVEVSAMDGTRVSLSTASEASTRKSGAVTGRPTQPYTEPVAARADASLSSAAPATTPRVASSPMKPSGSNHSFSTVASSYRRDYVVPDAAASSASSPTMSQRRRPGPAQAPQATAADGATALPNSRRRRASGSGSGSGGPGPHTGTRRRSSSPVVGTGHRSGRAGPVMSNPNPWVPSGAKLNATSTHVDPTTTTTPATAAAASAGASAGGSVGAGHRRSSQARLGSTPAANGRRSTPGAPAAAAHHRQLPPQRMQLQQRTPAAGYGASAGAKRGAAPVAAAEAGKGGAGAPHMTRRVVLRPLPSTGSHGAAKVESVVEYALSLGDAAGSEAGTSVGRGSGVGPDARTAEEYGGNGTALSKPGAVSQHYPNSCGGDHDARFSAVHTNDGEGVGSSNDFYRASLDISGATAITSGADSAFLQPFTEAQLAAQLDHARLATGGGIVTPPTNATGVSSSVGVASPVLFSESDADFRRPRMESSRGSDDDDDGEADLDLRDAAASEADDARDRAAVAAEFGHAVHSPSEGDVHTGALSVSATSGDDAEAPHSTGSPGNTARPQMRSGSPSPRPKRWDAALLVQGGRGAVHGGPDLSSPSSSSAAASHGYTSEGAPVPVVP